MMTPTRVPTVDGSNIFFSDSTMMSGTIITAPANCTAHADALLQGDPLPQHSDEPDRHRQDHDQFDDAAHVHGHPRS